MKKILILALSSILLSKGFNFNYSEELYLKNEIKSIQAGKVNEGLYMFPSIDLNDKNEYLDIFKQSRDIKVHPIFGLRYSNASFEMFEDYINSDLLWITPGLEINFYKPIVVAFFDTGISIQGWSRFDKHSAYGFNGNSITRNLTMFPYNPDYSFEFYTNTGKPENGIDFDQGEGAVALTTPWADILVGKFRTKLGPFFGGNLSIGEEVPAFPQFQVRIKSNKANFTFIAGELSSNLFEAVNYSDMESLPDYLDEGDGLINQLPRYIVNHRFDYKIKNNFRIGLYEQIIFGNNFRFIYMIPTIPFWSAQHSTGDGDNLQMGFDIEYIKNNRRLYMSLIMDEWAPYDTFNSEHHNWFGGQLGYSQVFSDNVLLKFEYSRIEPQVYTHDNPINEAMHSNYPLGFWSGGDSEEIFLKLFLNLKNMKDLEFNLRHTIIGNPRYDINADFLEGDLKKRLIAGFKINKKINSKFGPINYVLKIHQINNENLYEDESFTDCQISLLYNINY